jgi:hypothetical protein
LYRDENIRYSFYDYDGLVGGASTWSSVSEVFPAGHAGTVAIAPTGSGIFQNGALHEIEESWGYVDRVTAVADRRIPGVRGDLHIVFSGGDSPGKNAANTTNSNALYYSRFNRRYSP